MKEWLSDTAAIILALGVACSIIILSINELTHPGHLTTDETTVIATILGAGIGAIATYIGGKVKNENLH